MADDNKDDNKEIEDIDEQVEEILTEKKEAPWKDALKRRWYRFSKNPLSKIGLAIAIISIFLAIFGRYVVPHPTHA
ncbi:MAG: hypothetical protein ACOCTK_03540, partial [Candidatus Saliniplasma sp.]